MPSNNTKVAPVARASDGKDVDLARLLHNIRDGKWLIIGMTCLGLSAAFIYTKLATPIYRVDALVQVEDKDGSLPGLSELSEMFTTKSSGITEIEVLKSRNVIGKTVDELNLQVSVKPNYLPVIGNYLARQWTNGEDSSAFVERLFQFRDSQFGHLGYASGGESVIVEQFILPSRYMGKGLELKTIENQGFEIWYEDKMILSGQVGESVTSGDNLSSITISRLEAEPGASFTLSKKHRTDTIRDYQKALIVEEKGKMSGILSLKMDGENKELTTKVLASISNFYQQQSVTRMSAEAASSLEFLQSQLPKLKAELTASEDLLSGYQLENESVNLSMETESVLTRLVNLESKLSELSFTEADISRRFTPQHPNYKALQRKKAELLQEKDMLNTQIGELPETQQEILRLSRDLEVNQGIYLNLLNKVQELNVAKAGTVGNIRILDHAASNATPVSPRPFTALLFGSLLGLALAMMTIAVRNAMNRGVENPEEFEQIGIPVYASIPQSIIHAKRTSGNGKLKPLVRGRSQILAEYAPTELAVEALRSLRTNLHFAMMEAKNNIIMISGPEPQIGKSFISSNLAAVIANSGQRVLIIDADLRRGYLHKQFGQSNKQGLSEVLIGELPTKQAIQDTNVENLHLLTRGQNPPNPSELLMNPRFNKFLEEMSKEFDIVILDTPPILAVTDAGIIGQHCGTSFLVGRYSQTPLKQMEVSIRRFEQSGVDIRGIIFNGVIAKSDSYEYGYYTYEYKADLRAS